MEISAAQQSDVDADYGQEECSDREGRSSAEPPVRATSKRPGTPPRSPRHKTPTAKAGWPKRETTPERATRQAREHRMVREVVGRLPGATPGPRRTGELDMGRIHPPVEEVNLVEPSSKSAGCH